MQMLLFAWTYNVISHDTLGNYAFDVPGKKAIIEPNLQVKLYMTKVIIVSITARTKGSDQSLRGITF